MGELVWTLLASIVDDLVWTLLACISSWWAGIVGELVWTLLASIVRQQV